MDGQYFDIDLELLNAFIEEAQESLAKMDEEFLKLESNPGDTSVINDIFRRIQSIKGTAAFFGLVLIKDVSHKAENILDEMRQGKARLRRRQPRRPLRRQRGPEDPLHRPRPDRPPPARRRKARRSSSSASKTSSRIRFRSTPRTTEAAAKTASAEARPPPRNGGKRRSKRAFGIDEATVDKSMYFVA
jgi:chemotaxis protein histidine kinase CheA